MKEHITIIPADSLVVVNGECLHFSYSAPASIHAIQWLDGAGHIEYVNASLPNKPLSGEDDYAAHVAPYAALWEAEKARIETEANKPPTLGEARAAKIILIDEETSAAILAGFDYQVEGKLLHFSYDLNDQQNFADTANASTLAKLGVEGVPQSVTWNGWDIARDETGAEVSRSLVRLTLTPDSFLSLYMGGALIHKAMQMETGGTRKAAAGAATTVKELEAI